MTTVARRDEWSVITGLLPEGWEEAARTEGAFRRARYTETPGDLLRLLLFHAVSGTGLRETVAQAKAAGLASMSQVGLYKRMRTSGQWLRWIASQLAAGFREVPRESTARRIRIIDSTTIQQPASKGTDWRLHYTIDLASLDCDWFDLTTAKEPELLERTPVTRGDLLLGDRNFLRPKGVRAVVDAGGDVIIRMKWAHSAMTNAAGKRFKALEHGRRLRVGKVGDWDVTLATAEGEGIRGRVVAVRLPAPVGARAERRVRSLASKKQKGANPKSAEAAHFVFVFTTLPRSQMSGRHVLELYRCRWQIELVFKRLKQLLKLGQLPHKQPAAARAWIAAKLVVALLLEALFRNSRTFSPWGYRLA